MSEEVVGILRHPYPSTLGLLESAVPWSVVVIMITVEGRNFHAHQDKIHQGDDGPESDSIRLGYAGFGEPVGYTTTHLDSVASQNGLVPAP